MKETNNTIRISFTAMMAAMIYVLTMFRFPFLGSKLHFANALCLLSGLLLGPVYGGLAAGLGSGLYDALAGGYGLVEALITFASKFAMAWVCGRIARQAHARKGMPDRTALACVAGALTYVALYMLKTFIFNAFVYGYPMSTVGATMVSKLVPSLINAAFAFICAPIFYHAVVPALRKGGVLRHMSPHIE